MENTSICSGQDRSATSGQEFELYLGDILPVLRGGMDFLRAERRSIGCPSCRLIRGWTPVPVLRWRKSLGRFMRYTQALDFQMALRLGHEVAVTPANAQVLDGVVLIAVWLCRSSLCPGNRTRRL
ncbi:phenylacetaldoxime dehydratase family protein [Pseudomonas piscis]|uniref:phenylacetaldoxime dehydratase family protein n=1 Tax=Pseudomonas piscis TaxID=2614538 RepID=UPI003D33D000